MSMSISELPTNADLAEDFKAAFKISVRTWVLLISLLLVVAGAVWTARANITKNAEDIVATRALVDKKADIDRVNDQYNTVMNKLNDLHEDVREIRRVQNGTTNTKPEKD